MRGRGLMLVAGMKMGQNQAQAQAQQQAQQQAAVEQAKTEGAAQAQVCGAGNQGYHCRAGKIKRTP